MEELKWISIKERVPEYNGCLCIVALLKNDLKNTDYAFWNAKNQRFENLGMDNYMLPLDGVIGWYPVPWLEFPEEFLN